MINRARSIAFLVPVVGRCAAVFCVFAAVLASSPAPARADLEACGNIFLTGNSNCEYRPKEECMTQCMTTAVETACVTQTYHQCETGCTTTASTECETSCTTSCVDSCTTSTTTETAPSCMDLCLQDCDTDENSYCGRATHRGPCGRCAKHTCEEKCEQKCGDATQQTKVTSVTECMPTCSNACAASCTAKVNTQCQVDCQDTSYTQCEQQMIQTCQTECKDKGGAIFCDGQFVNAGSAQSCADELDAKINIHIDIEATAKTVGDSVTGAADDVGDEVDKACSIAGVGMGAGGGLSALAPMVALALLGLRRRRSSRR